MKTITTKYYGATPYRPSRVTASDEDGHKVILTYEDETTHDKAAHTLCTSMGWNSHDLVRGNQKSGNVYVFLDPEAVISIKLANPAPCPNCKSGGMEFMTCNNCGWSPDWFLASKTP